MAFNITKEFIHNIERAVLEKDNLFIQEHVVSLHAADIAEIFNDIEILPAKYLSLIHI